MAHGNENHDDDPDEITDITFDETPTYYADVKPILVQNCVTCHQEGQIAGYLPLTNDEENLWAASDLAYFTAIRYMPPWMPSQDSLPMRHNRSLTDYEIAVIHAWSEGGAPMGDEAEYVAPEDRYELIEIRTDMTLQLEESNAYMPEEGVDDDYRCFAFTPELDESVYLTGYEFIPDITEMAHHGIVYLVDSSAQAQVTGLDDVDGRPGWSCYTGTGVDADEEFLGTWTPGTLPVQFPDDTGYLIEPDDIIIVQMHYNLTITREPDRTEVTLQFAQDDELADIRRLMTFELQAPVEIPCPTGVDGEQCDRDFAIERATELYGENWIQFRPDYILNECGQTIADYAENTGESATTFCEYDVPLPLTVMGVFGHMHELGKSFQLELNPGTDDAQMLLNIPAWDFHWQDRYQLIEPLQVSFGDEIRMTCTWDNTLSDDPRYVVWGEGTADEMCFATVMLLAPGQ